MVTLTVGTNTYGTLAECDAYLDESARAAALWIGVAPDDKKRAMITAYRRIEAQRFQGTATGVSIVTAIVIANGGTGYSVNDILTSTEGTFGEALQAKVTAVSSGVVTAVEIQHAGTYTVEPSAPTSTAGGGGSGCTLTLTFGDQVSDFPRSGLEDCDGDEVDSTTYPDDLKSAQFEYAFEISQDTELETAGSTGENIKSVGAGSAKVEFFRPTLDGASRFPAIVTELIGCFFESATPPRRGLVSPSVDNESTFADVDNYGLTGGL